MLAPDRDPFDERNKAQCAHPFIVACDLGGTTMDLAIVDATGRIRFREQVASPGRGGYTDRSRGQQTLDEVARLLEAFIGASAFPRGHLQAVGIGLPGITDPQGGLVSAAPALGWWDTPVVRPLEDRLGLPIFIENDVNAAAVAEHLFGAGARMRDFVFVAIGTGIGAGLVLQGELYRGHRYRAGEAGYLTVDREWVRGRIQAGHIRESFGCWESLASGTAVPRIAHQELPHMPAEVRAAWHGKPLTGRDVLSAAAAGDPLGLRTLDRLAENLALGLTNIIALLDPEAIILGGGIAQAGSLLVDAVVRWLDRTAPWTPPILLSELGPNAGVLGAAAIALQALQHRAPVPPGGDAGNSAQVAPDSLSGPLTASQPSVTPLREGLAGPRAHASWRWS